MARRKATLPRGLVPLIPQEKIGPRLSELAGEIQRSISRRERPLAVVVLHGAFIFAADLLRRLRPDFSIDVTFLRCASYGSGTRSSGRVLLPQDLDQAVVLRGRTVLLIDDILDTGLTINFLTAYLLRRGAARVRVCVLLQRASADARRVKADFCGFSIGPDFVVGYGLDYNGRYRHLPGVAAFRAARVSKRSDRSLTVAARKRGR